MKKIVTVLLIASLTIAPTQYLSANEALDAFMRGKKIEFDYNKITPPMCDNCVDNKPVTCPAFYDYVVDSAVKGTFYSGITGSRIVDTCIPKNVPMPSTVNDIARKLQSAYGAKRPLNIKGLELCFKENKISNENSDDHKKILLSYMYAIDESLIERQENKIKEIALSDQLLGKKVLSDIHCSDHEALCSKLKQCSSQQSSYNEIVDYSIESLDQLMKLENQLAQTHQMLMFAGNVRTTPADIKNIQDDIKDKMKFIKDMNPWMNGDIIKSKISEVRSYLSSKNVIKARESFSKAFTQQIQNARGIEKKELIEINLAQDCLVDDYGCTDKSLEKINSYFIPKQKTPITNSNLGISQLRELNISRDGGACVARLINNKDKFEEDMLMVGRVFGGLALGAAGGVIRLGSIASKFYQSGSRLKGISAASALGVQGKLAIDTLTKISNSCQKAMNNLNRTETNQQNMCSDEAKNIFKIAKLKPCITDIALATIPAVLALKGSRGAIGKLNNSDDNVKVILGNSINNSQAITRQLTSPVLNAADKKHISEQIVKMNLKDSEILDVIAKINNTAKTAADKNRISNYINYVGSLKPGEKMAALREIGTNTFKAGNVKGSYTSAFLSKEGKFNKYERFHQILQERKLKQQGLSPKDAKAQSVVIAKESRDKMHKKIYACQSKTVTPEHKAAAAKFVGLNTAIGIAGTGFGNYRANSDVYEKDKVDWFAKLGYDIAMSIVISRLTGKILTTAGDGPLKKYFKSNAAYAGVGSLDAIVYSNIYGVSKADAEKKLETIKNSPELAKELKILEKYIDQNKIADKFEDQILNDYKKILSSNQKTAIMGNPPYKIGYETFNSLTAKDLDNPVIRDRIVQGIIVEMNKGVDNPVVSTGDLGADRWVHDRVWSAAIGVPKGIIISAVMFQILCVGSDKPFTSLGLATGVQVTNQFLNGDAYYRFRREFIGQ